MNSFLIPLVDCRSDGIHFCSNESKIQAFKNGFFALKIPDDLNVGPLVLLAKTFRSSALLSPLIVDSVSDQASSLSLSRLEIRGLQSEDVDNAMDKLSALAMSLVALIFEYLNVDRSHWVKILGRCSDFEAADYALVLNSFDAGKSFDVGMTTHKDMGWINFVYSEQPGFELYTNGEWTSISPMPSHLLVSLGILWEILSKDLSRTITSPLHRVACQSKLVPSALSLAKPRTSFVFSLGPTRGNIFAFRHDITAAKYSSCDFAYSLSQVGSVQQLRRVLNKSFDQDEAVIQKRLDSYVSDLGF